MAQSIPHCECLIVAGLLLANLKMYATVLHGVYTNGPGHIAISDAKPVLRGLGVFHGTRGFGVSVEFKVKNGPITILGMTQTHDGRLKMVAAEGESIPGPIMRIGKTNSRLRYALDPATFMNRWCEQGPTHHVALGIGHQIDRLEKLARLLDLELVTITRSS